MSWGIKISLPGYDVSTATPEQLALSSDYISPKLLLNQTPAHANTFSYVVPTSLSAGSTTNLLTVAHGYSYTPASICHYTGYMDDGTGQVSYGVCPANIVNAPPVQVIAYCTPTQFKIDLVVDGSWSDPLSPPPGGQTLNFRYYILAESAT